MKVLRGLALLVIIVPFLTACVKSSASSQVQIRASFKKEYKLSELDTAQFFMLVSNKSKQTIKIIKEPIVVNDHEIVYTKDGKINISSDLPPKEDEPFDAAPNDSFNEDYDEDYNEGAVTSSINTNFSVSDMLIVKVQTLGCQRFGTNIDINMKYHWIELKPKEMKKIPLELKEHLFLERNMENNYRIRIFLNQNDFEGAVKKVRSPVYQIRVLPDKSVKN